MFRGLRGTYRVTWVVVLHRWKPGGATAVRGPFSSKKEANDYFQKQTVAGKTEKDYPTGEICELESTL